MIVSVSKQNEIKWAELYVALGAYDNIEKILEERAAGHHEHEFLYYIGDNAVAFISLEIRYDYVDGTASSPVGHGKGIYVKPEYRNSGIAKELVEFAKKWTIEQGCCELASDCELSNTGSIEFHNKVGFKEATTIVYFTMDLRNK